MKSNIYTADDIQSFKKKKKKITGASRVLYLVWQVTI